MDMTAPRIRRPFTPQEVADRAAKAAATSAARGETLWFDGYTMTPTRVWAVYTVTTPERINKQTGEVYVVDYTVDVMGQTCNCLDFAHGGGRICKHLIGADRAIVAAHEAVEAARALLTPRENAAPITPKPTPKMPAPYECGGAARWTPESIPRRTRDAMNRVGTLNRAADFD